MSMYREIFMYCVKEKNGIDKKRSIIMYTDQKKTE